MSNPIQKNFPHWFGAMLGEFKDRECELDPVAMKLLQGVLPGRTFERVVRDGTVTLTTEVFAALLSCSTDTIDNWVAQVTVASSEKLPLFYAYFPNVMILYASQYLLGLRPAPHAVGCVAKVREKLARLMSKVASWNVETLQDSSDGMFDDAEKTAAKIGGAEAKADIDEVLRLVDGCGSQMKIRPRRAS